jgi:4-alpha-glucanotransferase
MASINTHDMPPFTAFWQGSDIGGRRELNQLDGAGAKKEAKDRESIKGALIRFLAQRGWLASHPSPDGEMALRAVLNFLSASNAVVVLVNLEDTWLEKEPQNIPGTQGQRPNWSRKARYGFKTFSQLPEVINVLCEIDRIRKQGARDEAKKGS